MTRHVAIDLGASGGRVAVAAISTDGAKIDILHRFPNGGTQLPTGLYWDVIGVWREILHGLRLAGEKGPVASVGVNSWGVDYALLDENDLLMDGMRHYRDPRTDGIMDELFRMVPKSRIYEKTGIQFMPLNTVYQLAAHNRQAPGLLDRAKTLLMVPDLFHFWLCGVKASERTISSTSQLYNPRSRTWDDELIHACGFPRDLFQKIVDPGTVLGEVRTQIGLPGAKVIAPAAHDTASAVAAVPAAGDEDWAYISSGTWALAGIESPEPIISARTLELNLTNEAGVHGTTRLLKNITGLWILQECRRAWGDPDYASLYTEAEAARHTGLIDPDEPSFLQVCEDMPDRVRSFASSGGPQTRGEITRCILESLAKRSAEVIDQLESVTGKPIRKIHIVGGGSQIAFLNQLIANASGRIVIAGPTDATLAGNLLLQAEAYGSIPRGSLRQVVASLQKPAMFSPM